MEHKEQLDKFGQDIAQLIELQKKQDERFDAVRVQDEEKLAKLVETQAEAQQKQAQIEAAIAKLADRQPESKAEEKRAEIEEEAVGILYRAGFGGFGEAKAAIAELEQKADMYNTLSDPQGGYISLPATVGALIEGRVFETSPVRAVANVVTISGDRFIAPHDDDELDATWDGEKVTPADTDTTEFNEIEIQARNLNARVTVTQNMLDDAGLNLVQYINNKAADKFARKEATAFVAGDGVAQPRGFLKYDAGTSTYAYGQIEQVNSGNATALTADGLIDLQNSLKEAYQAGAVFMCKRATFGAIRKLKDANNQYLIGMGAMGLDGSAGAGMTLLGKPLFFADDMEAVGAGGLAVAYGDFNRGYQIVDRIGIRVLANPYAVQNRVRYEFSKRVGGGVTNFEAIKLQKIAS